ncbi:pentatricopeptide repeat-containing protein At2g13600-like [Cryptomeria japonica]|uniref:pentatricopeptide repeat-containing protein At2g13600-like n=1 Tax=Cryptomeria japonica TaxID=3369 RepID=UPI0027DA2F08|nr:pentatricopeptide repeat-containing protein At2g13600-like [Cryptomeria japonica]
MQIHQKVIKTGFLSDVVVVTALIDIYAKCGSIQKARELFDNMSSRDVASWNAIIVGYAQNGLVDKALDIFKQIQLAGLKPDSVTFASVLPACANIGALKQGMAIHQKIIKNGFFEDAIMNSLIDMYAKCASIQKARVLFDKMPQKSVISWTAMIAGCAMHGYSKDSLELFELMKHSGTDPNHVTFLCILFACSHAGLVDSACKYFNCMSDSYCIMPTPDHYVCMVDLLGRAGYLEQALNFIIKIPLQNDVDVWMCLLGACRSHKNIELGEYVATLLFELDPKNAAPYVLWSNIYAEAGRWRDVHKRVQWTQISRKSEILRLDICSSRLEFVLAVADHFDPNTRQVKDVDRNVIMTLDSVFLNSVFRGSPVEEVADISQESAQESYEKNEVKCKKVVNTVYLSASRHSTTS